MRARLTVRSVEGVVPTDKDQIIWDTEIPGFGVKITPKGRRSYFLYYRTADGTQRRPVIGVHGAFRPEQAREIARRWSAEIVLGRDPSAERKATKTSITMEELSELYLKNHARPKKSASSAKNDEQMIRDHVLPALGKKKIETLARTDVLKLHLGMADTPYAANRTLALVSKMMNLAELWDYRSRSTNPASGVERYKEEPRQHFLAVSEARKLAEALTEPENLQISRPAADALLFLLFTGLRVNEALRLKWRAVDLETGRLKLSETKTGAKWVILNSAARAVLERRLTERPLDNPFVFPGRHGTAGLVNLQKPWRKVREKLGFSGVRLHDLRHTFASIAAGQGASLHIIGRMLNQTQQATTAGYAHLETDPVRKASEQVGAVFLAQKAPENGA